MSNLLTNEVAVPSYTIKFGVPALTRAANLDNILGYLQLDTYFINIYD